MIIDMESYVGLNVGGKVYQTSRTTLTRDPDSFFALLLVVAYRLLKMMKDDIGSIATVNSFDMSSISCDCRS